VLRLKKSLDWLVLIALVLAVYVFASLRPLPPRLVDVQVVATSHKGSICTLTLSSKDREGAEFVRLLNVNCNVLKQLGKRKHIRIYELGSGATTLEFD
jgi:hypothetical protein